MKKHTQIALIGTIVMACSTILNYLLGYVFHVDFEIFYYLTPFINTFGMLTLVNFFYHLHQKQNDKIKSTVTKTENPFEN